jgi:hypothetical protein
MTTRALVLRGIPLAALALVAATLTVSGCGRRDLVAGWRSLLAIRGASLGEPVELARAPYADAVYAGRAGSPKLSEASGLAVSQRRGDLLWSHNDSGQRQRLYAFGPDGGERGRVWVDDVEPFDWEDLASFSWRGTPYLLIADTGDNWSWRDSVELLVIEEPQLREARFPRGTSAAVAWRVRFRFEDGPRDCEAVAVDPEGPRALLLSKRTEPPVLYALSLLPPDVADDDGVRLARRLGEVPGIPPPTPADVEDRRWLGRYSAMPTGLDISRDGRLAAVLTYREAYLFERAPGEGWAEAFARRPQRIALPPLRQAEAIAFGADGRTLFVTSEKRPAPLFRLDWLGAELPATGPRSERSRSPR